MADVSKIFKPRRGKASTMAGTKASTILAAGELFVEVPNAGIGKGAGKLKMGDGTTAYSSLPYLLGDTSNDQINFTSNTDTTVATALNKVSNGAKLNVIIAALKQAVSLNASAITKLNDDLDDYANSDHNHDDRYYTQYIVNQYLAGKANNSHLHDERYAAIDHTHDLSIYTKDQVNDLLDELRSEIESIKLAIEDIENGTSTEPHVHIGDPNLGYANGCYTVETEGTCTISKYVANTYTWTCPNCGGTVNHTHYLGNHTKCGSSEQKNYKYNRCSSCGYTSTEGSDFSSTTHTYKTYALGCEYADQ